MGNPVAPDRTFLDPAAWTFENTQKDKNNHESHLERLFDMNPLTSWYPELQSTARIHQIEVDMKEAKTISGFRVMQPQFDPNSDTEKQYNDLAPKFIKIKISTDGLVWQDAANVEEIRIGETTGEITDIVLSGTKQARYIRFIISDQINSSNFGSILAELRVF